MNKTETIVLILILVVAFAGVWFLYSGPGLAIRPAVRTESFTEKVGDVLISVPPSMSAAQPGNLCVCKNAATGQMQSRPAGSGESIYSCRSSCVSQGLQFVALQQPGGTIGVTKPPTVVSGPPATSEKFFCLCKDTSSGELKSKEMSKLDTNACRNYCTANNWDFVRIT